ncbi:heme oxygenase (biliverdin-producing) [Rhizohabitans arisaemae]|uniref:biliverdin-producing heme oxygenase n=1 Tax=Rhizohabitans arisaemae TaxID=2720610 RepID=UPI0024B1198E|nr:biliverdin-producing heme oxygenase [Rhizohabitans arisaemae]
MTETFSDQIRTATWTDHEEAEADGYLKALMEGRLSREGYGEMVAQHYFAYLALEAASRHMTGDPVGRGFVFPELYRVPALERDLRVLYGAAWRDRIRPSKPTLTYVARINQVGERAGGYIAHHYTRYLGDLSGGQFIRQGLQKTYGFTPGEGGVDFYVFDEVGSLPRFKTEYRRRLDGIAVDEAEKRRIIREVKLAYLLNMEVLGELDRVLVPARGSASRAS